MKLGIGEILVLIACALKLLNVIDISWAAVFLPYAFAVVVMTAYFILSGKR